MYVPCARHYQTKHCPRYQTDRDSPPRRQPLDRASDRHRHAASSPVGGLDVAQLPTYTFQETSTGRTITVTDPGRGLITGKFRDIGKFKGPNLRALATRAPYFHNGSAKDLNAVVTFYDARFHIGFTAQEKSDLATFLQAL